MRVKIILILVGLIGLFTFPSVASANSSGFNAGNIISDEVFYNKDAMSVKEIQAFLNNQVPACDTWGQKTIYGISRKQYAINQGWGAGPYVCLQNYYENPNTGETSFEKGGGAFEGGISSAQIIWDAAQKYGINPQVLLVILKKEQGSLFADDWPLKSQYRYAMGYACPDSGPNYSANCASNQAGFYKQMNMAAWQLQRYKNNINEYQYRPGRTNYIQYSTQPSCGGKNVYIENIATASLYIYTPYTPNDAAIANYPGEAPCGAYGNRNFYFFFKEWFGEPKITSSFVRSESNPTVYLISDDMKYPVTSMSFVNSASNLGKVQFVSQEYLNNKTTGPTLNRLLRSKDGSVYFYDSNIKLPFSNCNLVADYGHECGQSIRLTDEQLSKFANGPYMTNSYRNISGELYGISRGNRHQATDIKSLTSRGFSSTFNVLSNEGISYLRIGNPIFSADSVIKNKDKEEYFYANSVDSLSKINNKDVLNTLRLKVGTLNLSDLSLKVASISGQIDELVKVSEDENYIVVKDKIYRVDSNELKGEYTVVSRLFIDKFNQSGDLRGDLFVKSASDDTVYKIQDGYKRYIVSMNDLMRISKLENPVIVTISEKQISSIQNGGVIIPPATMIKIRGDATVYVTDGYDKIMPLGSFYHTNKVGIKSGVREFGEGSLINYIVSKQHFVNSISFQGDRYLGINGVIYKLDTTINANHIEVSSDTANALNLSKAEILPKFLRMNGTIYYREGYNIRYIYSMKHFYELGGTERNLIDIDRNVYLMFTKI